MQVTAASAGLCRSIQALDPGLALWRDPKAEFQGGKLQVNADCLPAVGADLNSGQATTSSVCPINKRRKT